jgi:hypothetical protein
LAVAFERLNICNWEWLTNLSNDSETFYRAVVLFAAMTRTATKVSFGSNSGSIYGAFLVSSAASGESSCYGAVDLAAAATFVQARDLSRRNLLEGKSEITTGMPMAF